MRGWAGAAAALAGTALAASALAATGLDPGAARREYERLQEWRYESRPRAVPAEGTAWEQGVVSLRLAAGSLKLQEPTPGGAVTGLVFEGEGTLRLEVRDPFELAQLRRFADDESLERFETGFRRLVLRASDPGVLGALAGREVEGVDGPFERDRLAAGRHDTWLRLYRTDVDAAIVAALLDPRREYLRAELESEEHGWLTLEIEPGREEELALLRFHPGEAFLESWLSLDQEAGWPAPADVEHVDVEARLVRRGKDASFSLSAVEGFPTVLAEITAHLRLRCHSDGWRALRLELNPWAEVSAVWDAAGRDLPFLRDHIGGRSRGIDKRIYDSSLVVLLPEAARAGEPLDLAVSYEIEVDNYMPGRSWYPALESETGGLHDLHTATIDLTLRDDYDGRSMGRLVKDEQGDGVRHLRWEIETPQKMVSFVFNRKVEERVFEPPDLPAVAVFSAPLGHSTEQRMNEIGAEIVRSAGFFQRLLDSELPGDRLTAALTQAFHGQAFDGFLHLSEFSAIRHRTGPMELFLSHEVAHQWWGHQVGWKGYRDQWLSEGLAEYSALMYVESALADGEALFREALGALGDEVLGSIRSMMSPFARPGMALDNLSALDRIGPIGHGYRAATGEAKGAYLTLAYHKAALVVHMLRVLARFTPAGEQGFVDALRDFVRTHHGGAAGTRDLQAAVERHLGGDWSWFFDQWIYRAEVPAYNWRASFEPAGGEWVVTVDVEQRGVPEEFRMPVPVRVFFGDGSERDYLIEVDAPAVHREIRVAKPPKKVLFNPDRDILAKM